MPIFKDFMGKFDKEKINLNVKEVITKNFTNLKKVLFIFTYIYKFY